MPHSRRTFLLTTGAAVGAAALRPAWANGSPATVSRTGYALGTSVTLTVGLTEAVPLAADAHRALYDAFAELAAVEARLSIYQPRSQVSQLNHRGYLDQPHPDLVTVLRAALAVSSATDGAFDVSVQPLWDCYTSAKRVGRLPAADAIAAARSLVDWRKITVADDRVSLQQPGMAITLNGIAQGYAADRVAAVLARHGISRALIDTGELAGVGRKSDREPWRVGIDHPRDPEAYLSLVELSGRCLATSGDYATRFSEDRQHHHIFDPKTGRSPAELASVSVLAATAMQADAISTAVMVLGSARGLALLQSLPDTDGLLVAKTGEIFRTPGVLPS